MAALYQDQSAWVSMAILNVANMAKFSSDRAISDYAKNIWHVSPIDANANEDGDERGMYVPTSMKEYLPKLPHE